jgi:hypothetical protein
VTVRRFKSIQVRDSIELDRVQSNVELFAGSLQNIPLLNGRLVTDVALTTSETLIEHKLGRAIRGWIIVDKNASQDVYRSSEDLPERFLPLTAAGTVTVDLWVF